MRPYKTLLLALAFLSTLQCHLLTSADTLSFASNNQNGIRFLRTAETNNEERGISLDGLKNELSFMKLKWSAKQKMTPQEKLSAKQLKDTTKLEAALKKSKEKLESKALKARRKVQEQEAKAKEKVVAQQLKQAQKLKALNEKEQKRLAKELLKQDKMYNRWLVDDLTPEDVFRKFEFDKLMKKGLDPTADANYKHYTKYLDIYYSRYPDRLEKFESVALRKVEKVAESL
ncbi:hypothetical protein PPTG_08202 [Phytophthora nicotianae INRA-310]|uniref:RxLR effector protein n=1 Tax=Phytophthora nicotianae (strain INRA-310) TaxID=761204 RepID=W2QKC7_PHYN3|nr:hypothetical protein PPTG_08202 [Phytophthora nicotianae INRA-310]ETN13346.1 hypothetical protein PPTG_08202 [Phytophthora nicotianae INRA-310]